jgi:hypothetical protein
MILTVDRGDGTIVDGRHRVAAVQLGSTAVPATIVETDRCQRENSITLRDLHPNLSSKRTPPGRS